MSDLQKFARRRNWQKARITGSNIDTQILSKKEKSIVLRINKLKDLLITNWTTESVKLGLKAKDRCAWCKRVRVKNSLYCRTHIEEIKEIGGL